MKTTNDSLPYKLFAAALIAMLLCFIFASCQEEPTPPDEFTYVFAVQTDDDTLDAMYYLEVSAGDSIDANGYVVADTLFVAGQLGELPESITTDDIGCRYAQVFTYAVIGCERVFLPCRLFVSRDRISIHHVCINGCSEAFEI